MIKKETVVLLLAAFPLFMAEHGTVTNHLPGRRREVMRNEI